MKKIKILSLFNGMSTGTLALTQLGYDVTCYSSELLSNKAAIKVTQANFPNTIQLGDITQVHYKYGVLTSETGVYECGVFDMVLSGSPCTDLSIAGKRAGINGEESGLFYEFIRILEEVRVDNPNVLFLQENVAKGVEPKDILAINKALNIYPVRINSSLVSAQQRDRYYWSNIRVSEDWTGQRFTDIPQPEDRGILLKDIITSGEVDRDKATCLLEGHSRPNNEKAYTKIKHRHDKGLLTGVFELLSVVDKEVRVKTNTVQGYDVLTENDCLNLSFPTSTTRRGRITKDKSPCLLAGNEPLYTLKDYNIRLLNKIELTRLQTFPDDYCNCLTRNQAASVLGNGWTLEVIKHIFSFIKL